MGRRMLGRGYGQHTHTYAQTHSHTDHHYATNAAATHTLPEREEMLGQLEEGMAHTHTEHTHTRTITFTFTHSHYTHTAAA